MKRLALILGALLLLSGLLAAQENLKPSATLPMTDGSITDKEYQLTKAFGAVTVAATLGDNKNLYVAIQAKTAGWVAMGTGTGKMDGSNLFMAEIKDGQPLLSEQVGKGHSHVDVPYQLVSAWKINTADGITTLELVLPADKVTSNSKLNLLWAFSTSLDLNQRHNGRGVWPLGISAL